jgi:hypothetical protein
MTRARAVACLAALAAPVASACGGAGGSVPPPAVASASAAATSSKAAPTASSKTVCEQATKEAHFCTEVEALATAEDAALAACASPAKGANSQGCPTAGVVGKCSLRLPEGAQVKQTVYFYAVAGGPTAAELAKGCTADGNGTWNPP